MPKVSVNIAAYNAEKYIKETIDSILTQTFQDFEIIIVNDGSTDKTAEIIESYGDPRIKFLQNEKNMNLVYTRNRALGESTGEYIAIIDSDDIAITDRLETQVKFMDEHRDIGVCGSWIQYFGAANSIVKYPETPDEIKCMLLFNNVIAQPAVMMRRSLLEKHNLTYTRIFAEDYDLWMKSSFCFNIYNIQKVLLNYRISEKSYSQRNTLPTNNAIDEMFKEYLLKLDIDCTDDTIRVHKTIGNKIPLTTLEDLNLAKAHYVELISKNNRLKVYNEKTFRKVTMDQWIFAVLHFPTNNFNKIRIIWLNKMFGSLLMYKESYRISFDLIKNILKK